MREERWETHARKPERLLSAGKHEIDNKRQVRARKKKNSGTNGARSYALRQIFAV